MEKENPKDFNEQAPVVEEIKVGVVSGCSLLNVRVSPKLTADVLKIIRKGDVVILTKKQPKNDAWTRVRTEDGSEGFCMSEYITVQ